MTTIDHTLLLCNANIITMVPGDGRHRAVAVEKGRIIRVGENEDMKSFADQGWPVLDLNGKTILPGFIDTHQHTMLTGSQETAIHCDEAENIDAILDRLASKAAQTENGEWIRGSFLNEQNLAEKRMPTRQDLDRITTDHPVFLLHATCHLCSVNSKALDILDPPSDLDGLDKKEGRPTGVIRDPGILTFVHPAMAALIPEEAKVEFLDVAARMAIKKGITTIHALDGGDLGPGDTQVIRNNRHAIPVRLVCYNQSMDLTEVHALKLPRVGGCICADGAFEAHTAALFEPYADEPDNYGALTYSQKAMDEFILEAHRQGLQVAVHCEAERAIEQVLSAMEKAIRRYPRKDHRHRIEHLELPTFNQIGRMAEAGIIASMQPAFIPAFIGHHKMDLYGNLLGKERLRRVHPYRTILDAGVPIIGGSDSPVTPYNPLAGIQAAVTHPNPDERIPRMEALKMFTSTAAWSGFEEETKGAVAAGKLADLVVLDDDPFEVAPDKIADMDIVSVFIGGQRYEPSIMR